jgi:hypothetical protein
MKKTTKHLRYTKHLRDRKHLRFAISAFTLSLLWFYSPQQLLAQRKPASGKPATSSPAMGTPAGKDNKPTLSEPKQKTYKSEDDIPAAAGTYLMGAEKVDKTLEPARNHSYDIPARDIAGYDTVYVSTEMTTYLIFPTPIKLLDLGSKNYAGRIEQNKLLLKPVRGYVAPSAMMIETEDGQIYLHYIGYKQQPKRIFWDYRTTLANQATYGNHNAGNNYAGNNGNGMAGSGISGSGNKADEIYTSKLAYLKKQKRRRLFYKKENNIGLRISALAVDNTATYMLLEVDNKSSIPYKLEYVSFAYKEKRKRKTRRKVVGEENQVLPMLSQTTEMVKPRSTSELAYAFPLFANTLKGKLEIIVRETDGNRVVRAYVPAKVLAKTLYIPTASSAISYQK